MQSGELWRTAWSPPTEPTPSKNSGSGPHTREDRIVPSALGARLALRETILVPRPINARSRRKYCAISERLRCPAAIHRGAVAIRERKLRRAPLDEDRAVSDLPDLKTGRDGKCTRCGGSRDGDRRPDEVRRMLRKDTQNCCAENLLKKGRTGSVSKGLTNPVLVCRKLKFSAPRCPGRIPCPCRLIRADFRVSIVRRGPFACA